MVKRLNILIVLCLIVCFSASVIYAKEISGTIPLKKGQESLEVTLTRGELRIEVSDEKIDLEHEVTENDSPIKYRIRLQPNLGWFTGKNLDNCKATPTLNNLEIDGNCGDVEVTAAIVVPSNIVLTAKVKNGMITFLSGSILQANLLVEQGSLLFKGETTANSKLQLHVEQGSLEFKPTHIQKNPCIKVELGQGVLTAKNISIPASERINAWIEAYPKISLYPTSQCSDKNSNIELIVDQGDLSIK